MRIHWGKARRRREGSVAAGSEEAFRRRGICADPDKSVVSRRDGGPGFGEAR